MKKKIFLMLGLCLMLVGCRDIKGPGELFEAALTDLEQRTTMKTQLVLIDENNQELVNVIVDSQNLDADSQITITKDGITNHVLEDDLMARLGRFDLLVDVFSEFSYEKEEDKTTIMFTMPTDKTSLLADALSPWISESFEVIQGGMVVSPDGVMKSCQLNVATANHDYQLKITMLSLG